MIFKKFVNFYAFVWTGDCGKLEGGEEDIGGPGPGTADGREPQCRNRTSTRAASALKCSEPGLQPLVPLVF